MVVDNDEQDYYEFDSLNDLYEDEEQDNHLEEVKEQNDESLGEEVFVMENEEWWLILMSVEKLLVSYNL